MTEFRSLHGEPGRLMRAACFSVCVFLCGTDVFADPLQLQSDSVQSRIQCPESDRTAAVHIHLAESGKEADYFRRLAGDVISLKPGDCFSQAVFRESLQALRLVKKFQDIRADTLDSPHGKLIHVRLKPAILVRAIKIRGEFPLFESDVRQVLTIYPGDVFSDSALSKQDSLVRGLFLSRGFPKAETELGAEAEAGSRNRIVTIQISNKTYVRVGSLDIRGNKAVSAFRLLMQMRTWRARLLPGSTGRFVENTLKQDVERLKGFYRKKGYAEVRAEYGLVYGEDGTAVSVSVTLDEGPHCSVRFQGRHAISRKKLKKDVVLFRLGNPGDAGVRASIRNMRARYRKAGFQAAEVRAKRRFNGADSIEKIITFSIEEGPRTIVGRVELSGRRQLEEKAVLDQMLTRPPGLFYQGAFNPDVLEKDVAAIKALYRTRGFLNAAVSSAVEISHDGREAVVVITIAEGVKTRVSSVSPAGDTSGLQGAFESLVQMRRGSPYSATLARADVERLSIFLSEKGFPHVKIQTKLSFSEDSAAVDVSYIIVPGPAVATGRYYLTGNFRTRASYIRKEINLRTGQPFSLIEMLESRRRLQKQAIFNSVVFKPMGLKEQSDTAHLFIELEETKPIYLNFNGGFDTEKGVYAGTKLGNRNLLGANKHAWLATDWNQLGGRLAGQAVRPGYLLETGILEPRLFRSRVSAGFSVFYRQEVERNLDFGILRYGASLGFNNRWFGRWITGIAFNYENRNTFGNIAFEAVNDSVYWREMSEPRNVLLMSPTVIYDSRNSFIRPKRGTYANGALEFSQGMDNPFDDYNKYEAELKKYFTPMRFLTVAGLLRAGFVHSRHADVPVPQDQAFFLGGTNSVRGFGENQLNFNGERDPKGALRRFMWSVELRWFLGMNFEATAFFDAGQLTNALAASPFKEHRQTAGGGLRYITPIGPIGLLHGRKLRPRPKESLGQWHFSLGYTF